MRAIEIATVGSHEGSMLLNANYGKTKMFPNQHLGTFFNLQIRRDGI